VTEHVITTIRNLLEADVGERGLERASDPESFFKMAMQKLRRQRHLGQLHQTQWKALVEGAKLHGYHVYLACKSLGRNAFVIKVLGPVKVIGPTKVSSGIDLVGTTITRSELKDGISYRVHKWTPWIWSRAALNNKLVKSSKLILSQTDYTKVADGNTLVQSLGVEDVFEE